MNYIGIYAFAALGLVLLTGVGGLTSFGQAAFVGIGAYATAWYTAVHGGSPWIGLLLALALTGLVATILGAATLRLGGHFLPLSTIAWGIAIYFLFGNIDALGRYSGLSGIPPISHRPALARRHHRDLFLHLGAARRGHAALPQPARLAPGPRHPQPARRHRHGRKPRDRLVPHAACGLRARRRCSPAFPAGSMRTCNASSARRRSTSGPGIELLLMALVGGAGQIAGAVVGAAIVIAAQERAAGRAAAVHALQRAARDGVLRRLCSSCCCRRRAAASCRWSAASCRGAAPIAAGAARSPLAQPRRARAVADAAGADGSSAPPNGSARWPPSTT